MNIQLNKSGKIQKLIAVSGVCSSSMFRVYGCVRCSISLLCAYMSMHMPSSPRPITGVPSDRTLPSFPITAHNWCAFVASDYRGEVICVPWQRPWQVDRDTGHEEDKTSLGNIATKEAPCGMWRVYGHQLACWVVNRVVPVTKSKDRGSGAVQDERADGTSSW